MSWSKRRWVRLEAMPTTIEEGDIEYLIEKISVHLIARAMERAEQVGARHGLDVPDFKRLLREDLIERLTPPHAAEVYEQSRIDREFARAAMEADLNKHFPLIEDHLDDGYQVSCDATDCDFSTDIGHYGAIMTQWNGHIAEILSISGSNA